jgi:hypothetical protein
MGKEEREIRKEVGKEVGPFGAALGVETVSPAYPG